jgi:hypothetical protein
MRSTTGNLSIHNLVLVNQKVSSYTPENLVFGRNVIDTYTQS